MPETIPRNPDNCIANKRDGTRCTRSPTNIGAGLLCMQHARIASSQYWPFVDPYEAHRDSIVREIRISSADPIGHGDPTQAGNPHSFIGSFEPSPEPAQSKGGQVKGRAAESDDADKDAKKGKSLFDFLLDAKVLGSAGILSAAFLSEYFFLKPFNLDFRFYAKSIEAIPLFIGNLFFILVLTCVIFSLFWLAAHLLYGLYAFPRKRKERQEFLLKERETKSKWMDENRDVYSEKLRKIEERIDNLAPAVKSRREALQNVQCNPHYSYLTKERRYGPIRAWMVGYLKRWSGQTKTPATRSGASFPAEDTVKSWAKKESDRIQVSLNALEQRLDHEKEQKKALLDKQKQYEKAYKSFLEQSKARIDDNMKDLWVKFLKEWSGKIRGSLWNGFPPKFIRQPAVALSFLVVIVAVPLSFEWMEGRTMVACAKSLVGARAETASRVCPTEIKEHWVEDWAFVDAKSKSANTLGPNGEIYLVSSTVSNNEYKVSDKTSDESTPIVPSGRNFSELYNGLIRTAFSWLGLEKEASASIKVQCKLTESGCIRREISALYSDLLWTSFSWLRLEEEDTTPIMAPKDLVLISRIESKISAPLNGLFMEYFRWFGLARNYPIVTVVLANPLVLKRADSVTQGPNSVCAEQITPAETIASGGDVTEGSQGGVDTTPKVQAPLKQDTPTAKLEAECLLTNGSVSARMVYLGEFGSWTLLYSLGLKGAPVIVKSNEIVSISYSPASREMSTTGSPQEPQNPHGVIVVPISVEPKVTLGTGGQFEVEARFTEEQAAVFKTMQAQLSTSTTTIENAARQLEETRAHFNTMGEMLSGTDEQHRTQMIALSDSIQQLVEKVQGMTEQELVSGKVIEFSRHALQTVHLFVSRQMPLSPDSVAGMTKALIDLRESLVAMPEKIREEISGELVQIESALGKVNGPGSSFMAGMAGNKTFADASEMVLFPKNNSQTDETATPGTMKSKASPVHSSSVERTVLDLLAFIGSTLESIDGKLPISVAVSSADLSLPGKFVGVEQRLVQACLRDEPIIQEIEFGRYKKKLPEKALKAALDDLVDHLLTTYGDGEPSRPIMVLLEGTADSVGLPRVNLAYSDDRASYVHQHLETSFRRGLIEAGRQDPNDSLRRNILFVSYGSGEWTRREAMTQFIARDGARPDKVSNNYIQPRSVLVRVCPLTETAMSETARLSSQTN